MESVQRISAECQRYLRDIGIDQLVWIHAMETPKDELFYFKPAELLSLKLATPRGAPPATASAGAQAKGSRPSAFRRIPPVPQICDGPPAKARARHRGYAGADA